MRKPKPQEASLKLALALLDEAIQFLPKDEKRIAAHFRAVRRIVAEMREKEQ